MGAPYPYDAAWKASVDRSSPEWIEYTEATWLVKRYIRTRLYDGKEAAVEEFEATCHIYLKNSALKEARVARVREVFMLLWESERKDLEAQVLEQESVPHAA